MKDKEKFVLIYYMIPIIIFILLLIYINNQVNISISYKNISAIEKKITAQNNFHKKLLLEYYTSMDLNNIESKAKKKGFIIKSSFKDYKLVETNEKN